MASQLNALDNHRAHQGVYGRHRCSWRWVWWPSTEGSGYQRSAATKQHAAGNVANTYFGWLKHTRTRQVMNWRDWKYFIINSSLWLLGSCPVAPPKMPPGWNAHDAVASSWTLWKSESRSCWCAEDVSTSSFLRPNFDLSFGAEVDDLGLAQVHISAQYVSLVQWCTYRYNILKTKAVVEKVLRIGESSKGFATEGARSIIVIVGAF